MVRPLRGVTLGMFDDAISFIISCMFEFFLEKTQINEYMDNQQSIHALFFGDDCDIIFKNYDIFDARQIGNKWIYFMDSFGIYVNLKKSCYSPVGIFCEVYGWGLDTQMLKHVYYLIRGLDILLAHNTAHAKNLFNGYYRSIKTYLDYVPKTQYNLIDDIINNITSTIISSFPYEFLENEYQFPFEVGGWYQFLDEGLNLLLKEYFDGNICKSLQRVYKVKFPKPYKFLKKDQKDFYNDNVSKNNFWKHIQQSILEDTDEDYFFEKYCNSLKSTSIPTKCWWEYQELRFKNFNSKIEQNDFLQTFWSLPFTKMKLDERCFNKIDLNNQFGIYTREKPEVFQRKKSKVIIDKLRALDIIKTLPNIKESPNYCCQYLKKISWQDLYSSLDYDLANCKYIVPTHWWRYCRNFNISIETFFKELFDQGFNPIEYEPKFYKKNDKILVLDKIFNLNEYFIMWCEQSCTFTTFNERELLILDHQLFDKNYENIMSEKLGFSLRGYQDYVQKLIDFGYDIESSSDEEDDPKTIEDQKQMILNYQDFKISENFEIKILEYIPSEEKLVSHPPSEEDESDISDFETSEKMVELYPGHFVTVTEWTNIMGVAPDALQFGSRMLGNIPDNQEESGEDEESSPG